MAKSKDNQQQGNQDCKLKTNENQLNKMQSQKQSANWTVAAHSEHRDSSTLLA
jgi:hypothetical protein